MTRRPTSERGGLRLLVAACLSAAVQPSFALSFGAEQLSSSLGQPLRLAIPLLGATGDSLDSRCFRLATPLRSDGIAALSQARVELQTSSTPPLLIVRSSRPVDDPVVRVAVEATCDTPIRREFTVLLDPPPVSLPEQAPAAPVAAPVTLAPSNTAAPTAAAAPGRPVGTATPSARKKADSNAASPKKRSSEPRGKFTEDDPRSKGNAKGAGTASKAAAAEKAASKDGGADASKPQSLDQLQVQRGVAAGNAPVEDASIAALAIPRLKISGDLPSFDPATTPGRAAPGDELQAAIAAERRNRLLSSPIDSDLAPRLEADLVVAKRRLAEMQAQLNNAGVAPSGADPAKAKAAPPPGPTVGAQQGIASQFAYWREWLWVPALLLVAGLLAFLLKQRKAQRQQRAFATSDEDAVTVVHTRLDDAETVVAAHGAAGASAAPAPLTGTEGMAGAAATGAAAVAASSALAASTQNRTREEREASERLDSPLFQLRDTESSVDVTELSHVTDEAQVYADLGRNDQAIELLRAHIDTQSGDRTSPAPWLMIFDLYRRTNNRAGYDELAPQFRKHFNGRMPDWDNYGHELALDDGLEAFPHLVARIERDWGTPEAKKFLDELLYDNRGGSRLGFSLAAYRDILLLLQLHEALMTKSDGLEFAAEDWESRGANDHDGTPEWDLSLDMIDPPSRASSIPS